MSAILLFLGLFLLPPSHCLCSFGPSLVPYVCLAILLPYFSLLLRPYILRICPYFVLSSSSIILLVPFLLLWAVLAFYLFLPLALLLLPFLPFLSHLLSIFPPPCFY